MGGFFHPFFLLLWNFKPVKLQASLTFYKNFVIIYIEKKKDYNGDYKIRKE